jgi:hypothetical protein
LAPKENLWLAVLPFRKIPQDAQKEYGPNHHDFREARKGAPTHRAGTPWRLCRGWHGFCQAESAQFLEFLRAPPVAESPQGPTFVIGDH